MIPAPSTSDILKRLLSQPTAPFREAFVAAESKRLLDEHGIPCFLDPAGNLIAGVASARDLSSGFRIGLIAHMDHPGFHVERRARGGDPRLFEATFWGGAPFDGMPGAEVLVYDPAEKDAIVKGRVREVRDGRTRASGRRLLLDLDVADGDRIPKHAFGSFDLPGVAFDGDFVSTRAADDVAGCAIALGAIIDDRALARVEGKTGRGRRAPLFAVLTRAEEVGFIGCLDLLESRRLRSNCWMISLEASRELPEAELGKGPVLRIGDKTCLFDAEFAALTWLLARDLETATKKTEKPFKFQRRLMSGGTCEATPLTLFGIKAAALAVPLRNYHNIGEDGRPAPEIISLGDVEGARRFCVEIARRLTRPPRWRDDKLKDIRRDYRLLKERLQVKVKVE